MGRIAIVSASVGAGHDGAATELAARLEAAGFEVLRYDFLDLLPGGHKVSALYQFQLRRLAFTWEWLLAALQWCPPLTRAVAAWAARCAPQVAATIPDDVLCVVSTYPLASQALGRLRRRGELDAPLVTYLTDMSVHRLWIAPGADSHLALHQVPAAQARGLSANDVAVVAPAVRPGFRPVRSAADRAAARRRFGLPEDGRYALVVAGSWGVGKIDETVREIAETGAATPVVVCGRNEDLRRSLAENGVEHALGWVDDMPELMRACDLVVQNAGGLSSLEAMASGLPVITYRCLPGHGRTNARALHRAGLAPWVRRRSRLAAALTRALEPRLSHDVDDLFAAADPALRLAALAKRVAESRA